MINLALELNKALEQKLSIVCVRSIRPLDTRLLDGLNGKIITLEENVLNGGFGQAVSQYYQNLNNDVRVFSFGVKDEFIPHGKVSEQMDYCGLNIDNIREILN